MVTKAMLQEAAGLAENAILKSMENIPHEPHQFSARFERKMDKLIRRVRHPIRYAVTRSAAAALLLAFFLFGMVFAISPDVRASVIKWVKNTFFVYSQYTNNEIIDDVAYEYCFRETPEGYSEKDANDINGGRVYMYTNQVDDYVLLFAYLKGDRTQSLFVKTDSHSHVEGIVNGNNADIYITDSETETNAIVWYVEETDTLFCISGKLNQKMLIALAENVVRSQK